MGRILIARLAEEQAWLWATTLSLENAIHVLEAKFVDNGEATTRYCVYAVHISSGSVHFCVDLRTHRQTLLSY